MRIRRDRSDRHTAANLVLTPFCAVLLQACNGSFYQPNSVRYSDAASMPVATDEVRFASADGTNLHAWFLHAKGDVIGTVLFFHGNAQNLTSHVGFVDWLPARGFNVLVFDYRGYGASAGSPSRSGIHEDSIAAIDYVRNRPDVDPNRIVVFAQSLGGACAVAALGEGGTKGVRGLALDSTFASYIGMGNEALGGWFVTYPLAWLLLTNTHSPVHSIARIAPTPILFFGSPADPVVPMAEGRRLFAEALEPKEFLEVPIADHPVATRTLNGREKLVKFFTTCLGAK